MKEEERLRQEVEKKGTPLMFLFSLSDGWVMGDMPLCYNLHHKRPSTAKYAKKQKEFQTASKSSSNAWG